MELVPAPIALLAEAIEQQPEAPVNYLYRAEQWIVRGYVDEAQADFLAAQALSAEALAASAWGYLDQYYMDWAEDGLQRCRRQSTAVERVSPTLSSDR
ncbi:hypothetical protein [Aggregatilinea lenta]|uniref:hypothetical protein n=1 Tax=Aggregatilinea lenta TaxID=913108 RepID=UPI000E5B3D7A|nr:hypothetical protein [Aggregatilinea lenta]